MPVRAIPIRTERASDNALPQDLLADNRSDDKERSPTVLLRHQRCVR
jgi:hypothetical protein